MWLSSRIKTVTPSFAPRKTPRHWITLLPKILEGVSFAVSLIPFFWTIGIVALAVRARLYLGHWPRPSHPDPKHLPFDFHQEILWILFEYLKWSILVIPACYVVTQLLAKNKLVKRSLRIYLVGWGIIMAMMVIPRIDFVMWFLD